MRSDNTGGFLTKFVQLKHEARMKVADAYFPSEDAYFFQRSPQAFESVFQYYANGVCHRPPEVCPSAFLAELEFWRIPTAYIGSCCSDVVPAKEKSEEKTEENIDDNTFDNLMFGKLRRRMWTFLERPGSSLQAKAFELSSTLFVAISVMGLSFGTIPEFQVIQYMPPNNETIVLQNGTVTLVEMIEEMRVEHAGEMYRLIYYELKFSVCVYGADMHSVLYGGILFANVCSA
jgi:hypothetical protein